MDNEHVELEVDKMVNDMFAFFEANPKIEKKWLEGRISLQRATTLLQKWIDDHKQNN